MKPLILPKIVPEEFHNHFIPDESPDTYHGNKTAVNSSVLKLLDKSPATVLAHYMTQDVNSDDNEEEPGHFLLGRALHAALLEPERFTKILVKQPEFKGKGSVQEKKEWRADQHKDAMILTPKMFLQTEGMINSVLSCQAAVDFLSQGIPELSGYYRHPETGILCKVRPDLWNEGQAILLDVKSCVDASKRGFGKKILEFKYHLSMAMYSDGIYQISGVKPELCVFIAVEKKPPYEVAIYNCTEAMLQLGHDEYQSSTGILKVCLETNSWPQRQQFLAQQECEEIDLPEWVYKKGEVYE